VAPRWLYIRHKLFRYRLVEQQLAGQVGPGRLLDIGCGDGDNLRRFEQPALLKVGLEVSWPRLRAARRGGLPVLQGSGAHLPFPGACFDLVYLAHVLHHIAAYRRVLAEIARCLAPGGRLFVVESISDHPLLRLARRVRPSWQGDATEVEWRYDELKGDLEQAGFQVEQSGRYNRLFFLWEMLPLRFWPLEIFTPLFVYLDLLLARFLPTQTAHCYFVLRLPPSEEVT
jgi:ubiquinone/menaquinone biosynthesis C-methylase UbiE